MKKKFMVALGVSVVLLANPLSFSYAKNELVEGRALSMAHQYIENSLSDEAWAGNNPVISAQNKFYTDDAKKVSYIEYKVSCDSTPDCGFIMMNVDGNDVSVPIASPTGNTPSEILDQGKDVSEKLYYFGPFDLYSENEVTGDVQALDPQLAVDLRDDTQVKRSSEEAKLVKEQREALKTKLKDAKIAAKEFKKSEEFKKQKEEIKDQILNVPKEEFSMKALDFAFADEPDSSTTYISPGVSDKFIPGIDLGSNCGSKIPCYEQFRQTYNGFTNCGSGCSPTAIAMLFGYYDLNGKPNLITGTAPSYGSGSNSIVVNLVNTIRTLIGSTCKANNGGSGTSATGAQLAKQYAINKGYISTTSNYSTGSISTMFSNIKTEINANRPVITHIKNPGTIEGHVTVVYGYKMSPSTSNIVRMNFGWGNTCRKWSTTTPSTCIWRYSSIDQHLSAVFYNGSNSKEVYGITRFNIQ